MPQTVCEPTKSRICPGRAELDQSGYRSSSFRGLAIIVGYRRARQPSEYADAKALGACASLPARWRCEPLRGAAHAADLRGEGSGTTSISAFLAGTSARGGEFVRCRRERKSPIAVASANGIRPRVYAHVAAGDLVRCLASYVERRCESRMPAPYSSSRGMSAARRGGAGGIGKARLPLRRATQLLPRVRLLRGARAWITQSPQRTFNR